MRLKLFFLLFIFAQVVSANDIKISLLTCSPGGELYSTYGHSAILVEYPSLHKKVIYNYGIFDFRTPNFAVKFIKGDLLYMVSPERYQDFIQEYKSQGRGVIQQELDLTDAQEVKIMNFLAENMKPENRSYLYDFFFDNCSTRIRDLLESELSLTYPADLPKPRTFRTLLKPYLSDTPWYHFGTNLILGKPTDDKADFRNEMFLPDYLSENLAQATLDGHPLLKPSNTLIPKTLNAAEASFNAPLYTMLGVFLLSLLVSAKSNRFWRNSFDTILYTAAIASGLLFSFMWIATQHEVCHQNFNLLWSNPLFLILPIFALRGKQGIWKWALYYFIGVIAIWFLLPQKLPIAMLFFTLALLIRAAHRSGYLFTHNK